MRRVYPSDIAIHFTYMDSTSMRRLEGVAHLTLAGAVQLRRSADSWPVAVILVAFRYYYYLVVIDTALFIILLVSIRKTLVYCYNIEVFFVFTLSLRLTVIDRVSRDGLDPRLGQGGVGRRAPVLSFRCGAGCGRVSPLCPAVAIRCDLVAFGPRSVLGSADTVMPHSLIVPETAQSR